MLDRFPARLALVHMLPAVAAAHGIDHRPLLSAVGLDGGNPAWIDGIVARARIAELLTGLARRTGNAAIGLDLAHAADPRALGPAGQALGAGRTLGEALAAHIRQMPALQGGVSYRLDREGSHARLRHRLGGGTAEAARVLNEGIAGFMVRAIREMLGEDDTALQVTLPHRPQASAPLYDERLRAAVTFRAGDGITIDFDSALLDRPNRLWQAGAGADAPPLARGATQLGDDALVAALDRMFGPAALTGLASVESVARTLGLSPRSLQRRLAELGTSYERQLDAWRHKAALQALTAGKAPVQTIARGLGYADASHFIRAFHRWQGTTPAAWRRARQARGEQSD